MPTSLPVPSKGALRALRHLALGASCTVAFSAGLLTEDRRRRINTAREVHSNARKLKSARQYHNAGGATIETFEEQALKYREDAFWLPSNVLKNAEAAVQFGGGAFDGLGQDDVMAEVKKPPRRSPSQNTPTAKLPSIKPIIRQVWSKNGTPSPDSTYDAPSKPTSPSVSANQTSPDDGKLEQDLLATMAVPSDSFNSFKLQSDPVDRSFSQESVDEAISLQEKFRKQGRLDLADQIFDMVLSHGILSERQFYLFNPEDILSRLLSCSNGDASPDFAKVEKAASIFLTDFTDQRGVINSNMFALGIKICSEAYRLQLDDLVRRVFFRIESSRGNRPPPCVHQLMVAAHRRGLPKLVIRYFQKFYTQTSPGQQEFFDMCRLAIDSALELQRLDLAENVLLDASSIAGEENLFVSDSCLIRVLAYGWGLQHNIIKTRALFDRLERVIVSVRKPHEAYSRMIQYCVAARDEEATRFYCDQVQRKYSQAVDNAQIHGHLALAKAYRNDWDGVLEEFSKAHERRLRSSADLSYCFTPILQEYSKSHSLTELEGYIDLFTSTFELKINKYMMNFMVAVYAEAKEIDSLARWIDCAVTDGCTIDSKTMNLIFQKCHAYWKFSFEQVLQLFLLVKSKKGASTHVSSPETMVLLRQIAIKSRKSHAKMHYLKRFDKHSTDREGVYRSMAVTYAKDDFFATLRIYKRAQQRQTPLDRIHLSLAVRASLKCHEDSVEEATHLIKEAQQRRVSVRAAVTIVFVQQITRLSEEGVPFTRLVQVCYNTISAFENAGIEVPAAVVTHTSSCLHKRGFHGQAIDLWNSMCARLNISPSSLDLASLTSLLNAYIGLQDPAGIRWVIHMLAVNQLYPDKHFRTLLRNARKKTTRMIESQPCSDQVHEFLDSISDGLQKLQGMRAASMEEQAEVRAKTILIIEKAIGEEKAKAGVISQGDLNPQTKKTMIANPSKGMEADLWTSDGNESICDVDNPSAKLASSISV